MGLSSVVCVPPTCPPHKKIYIFGRVGYVVVLSRSIVCVWVNTVLAGCFAYGLYVVHSGPVSTAVMALQDLARAPISVTDMLSSMVLWHCPVGRNRY